MKLINIGIIVLCSLGISGCFNQPPEELALSFAKTGNYNLLSQKDKNIYSEKEFLEVWQLDTDLQLEPTSKYFLLEKYLKQLVKHSVSNIEKSNDKTKVTIITTYPQVLREFWFANIDLMSDDSLEKLNNLNSLYLKSKIDISDLKFIDRNNAIDVLSDGVYVNLAKIKASKEIAKVIKTLVEPIEDILDEDSEISSLIIYASDPSEFRELLSMAGAIEQKIETVKLIKMKIIELDADLVPYSVENYLKDAKKLLGIAKTFESLKVSINFKDIKISKAKGGGLALFGNFVYSGNDKIKYGHAVASFIDSKENVIGRQKLDYLLSDLYKGKVKSFGLKIDDQFMASKAVKVKIEPSAIF